MIDVLLYLLLIMVTVLIFCFCLLITVGVLVRYQFNVMSKFVDLFYTDCEDFKKDEKTEENK